MTVSLSSSETEAFINFYLSQEILWNVRHPQRHKKEHLSAAIKMVVAQMASHGREMSEEQVNAKIASLRTYYSRELKKVLQSEKSGAASRDLYKSTWEYFNALHPFLRSHVQPRQSTSNCSLMGTQDMDADFSITVASSTATCSSADASASDPSPDLQCNEQEENEKTSSAPPKKKKMNSADRLNTMMMATLQDISNKRKQTEDSDDLFGRQIALELKSIDDRKKKQILKLKINELIFQYQFES